MENRKLIDSIKKDVVKQIEADIKASVVKEMYGTSKKKMKKLRKQILKEVQAEMFAEAKSSKIRKKKKTKNKDKDVYNIAAIVNNPAELPSVEIEETPTEAIPSYDEGQTMEYRGFKFDVDRMSAIVTGKDRSKFISKPGVEKIDKKSNNKPSIVERLSEAKEEVKKKEDKKSSKREDVADKIRDIKKGGKKDVINKMVSTPSKPGSPIQSFTQGFNIGPGSSKIEKKNITPNNFPGLRSMNMVPSTKNLVKTTQTQITPAKKEEISFFVGKLKEGIDNLGKGEKNINYRHKKDDIYTFSFSKQKLGKDDFSFKFNLDLNMYTLGAEINRFEFNIDGFNFDKGFVEILDIIAVLDVAGMSLKKYIDEISGINTTAAKSKAAIKENIKNNVKAIRANTKLEKVIFDERILKVLRSNDINTYGQLKKIEELTSLRGVGSKTADKIEEIIKK